MDEIKDIMDTMPSTQPGCDPRELLTPVIAQNDDNTSFLAYDTELNIPLTHMIQMDMTVM